MCRSSSTTSTEHRLSATDVYPLQNQAGTGCQVGFRAVEGRRGQILGHEKTGGVLLADAHEKGGLLLYSLSVSGFQIFDKLSAASKVFCQ